MLEISSIFLFNSENLKRRANEVLSVDKYNEVFLGLPAVLETLYNAEYPLLKLVDGESCCCMNPNLSCSGSGFSSDDRESIFEFDAGFLKWGVTDP